MWHEGMKRILLNGEDYVVVAKECSESLRGTLEKRATMWGEEDPNLDWERWMLGMIYAMGKYILPEILRDHEVVMVEEEVLYDLPPTNDGHPNAPIIRLISIPDLILKRKSDGTYWYWEWKTTGWLDTRWLRQWDKDVQLMGGARSLIAKNITIDGCIVQGVYKGFRKDGRLNHILVNAYAIGGIRGVSRDQWSPKYVKGWDKVGTDEYEDGVIGWVDHLWELDQDYIRSLFPRTLPISINDTLVSSYFRQLWLEEQKFAYANEDFVSHQIDGDAMDLYYPQSFWECEPSIGMKCPFLDCCWNPEVGKDPVGSGLFVQREKRVEAEDAGDEEAS